MRVIAILPARNEAPRIAKVIAEIKRARTVDKIIVVDDASSDETTKVAGKAGAQVIYLAKHGGVGAATRAGLSAALRLNPQAIIFIDSDGQHDPRYIPQFLKKIESGNDFVIGCRDLSHYPIKKRFGNAALRTLANLLCQTGIKDPECGFRMITAEAARTLDLRAEKYNICMDFVYNVWKNKFKVAQVRINVPVYYKMKGTKIRTGIANFWWLLRRRVLG